MCVCKFFFLFFNQDLLKFYYDFKILNCSTLVKTVASLRICDYLTGPIIRLVFLLLILPICYFQLKWEVYNFSLAVILSGNNFMVPIDINLST